MRRPLLLICVCLFILTAFVMQIINPPPWNSEVAVSSGEELFVSGQVYKKEYRKTFDNETIIIYLKSIYYSKEAEASYQEIVQKRYHEDFQHSTKIICEVNMGELPQGEAGDKYLPHLGETILLQGQWQEFSHATNQGEFDLANYYSIEGIGGKVKLTKLLACNQKQWYVMELLFCIRQKLLRNLYNTFEQKEAALLAKMLLGDGSGLNNEVRDLYQDSGIVHILSISGLHISLIGVGIYRLLRRCNSPLRVAAVLGGVFIVLYGMLVGFGVSVCRAIGMYLIHMLGEIWGKTYDMLTAMGVLAIILVAENSKLVYHSGYLLSFGSVCGLGLLAPVFRPEAGNTDTNLLMVRPYDSIYIKWLKKCGSKIGKSFIVSLSVILFTLPIQLFFFYKIPVYSVFINLLVIPFMSMVMIIGFVVMLLPGLDFLCPIESLIFTWFEWLCYTFQKLPGHTWVTGRPQMWKILLYYGVLFIVIFYAKRLHKGVVITVLAVLVFFVGIRGRYHSKITFLDVGQGDCICVQTVSGECYLFDGGSSSRTNAGERIMIPYLQFCGISKIDAIFISHPDQDHTNGLVTLLKSEEIEIERLVLPNVAEAEKEFKELLAEAEEGASVEYVAKGTVWECQGLKITCLHPEEGYVAESNAYSACYLLETEGCNLLMTGDVEGEGERKLIGELQRRAIYYVDVLKVAHHGSKYSTSKSFLDVVNARQAIISCGRNNLYGHPHEETLERLVEDGSVIWSTADRGQIVIEVTKAGEVKTWCVVFPREE